MCSRRNGKMKENEDVSSTLEIIKKKDFIYHSPEILIPEVKSTAQNVGVQRLAETFFMRLCYNVPTVK